MATRERDERLQALYDAGVNVYSISKLNTVENCLYEAWNTYIKGERGKNGVYGILGTKIHDKLEEIMNNEATSNDLLPTLSEEIADLDMLGIDFPKDNRGGTSIRDNWIADMKHFCNTFVKPKGKFITEELILYKLNDNRYIQGYIDLIKHNTDGSISIYDWKTSSQFSKEDLLHHGRQLVLYAIAMESQGYKIKELAWIMLKYVEITFMGKARANSKNETEIIKVVNRHKIISELQPFIENDLSKLGYDELEIDILIEESKDKNSLDNLPDEIVSKYKMKPYVRKYDFNDELKNEAIVYINKMADIFESLTEEEDDWKPRSFYKLSSTGKEKEDTFFCNVLCNHRDTCKYIKKFNDTKTINKTEDDDLF